MQRKLHALTSLLTLATCAVLAMTAYTQAQDKKADPSGTWTWSVPGRNGGAARVSTLKLKVDGDKLTGSVTAPGRQGSEPRSTDIENGKIKGDEISFAVSREFNGNKVTQKYSGKVSGDSIKGKIEFERNGESQSRDWEAKRSTEKSSTEKSSSPSK
jgi:hypothetical protein